MVQEAIHNAGVAPREVSADAGYYSAQALDDFYALRVDPFVAPDPSRNGSPARAPGPYTGQPVNQGPDAEEAEDETGAAALRAADEDG